MASDEHTRWLLVQEPVRNMLDSFHDLVVGEALEHLLAHWAYENQDQGDYKVTVADALLAIDLMAMILDCRYWMKVQ